jgi:dihydrofolate reductase
VDAILMGRATFEAVRRRGDWPCPGKPAVVVTRRPLPDAPEGVVARGGDLAAVAAEMEEAGQRRVWVEGGGEVIRQMPAIRKLDLLEMALIPRTLGAGIPLFPRGATGTSLRLVSAAARESGAVHLVYEPA